MAVHFGQQLELYLSRDSFAAGRRLSGIVIYNSPKPIEIRSISVNVSGVENPAGNRFSKSAVFFDRLQILTGTKKPRFTAERISMAWNAFLGRNSGRSLSNGEHLYPFTFQLPASLPPSYSGKAGKVEYTVTACVQYPVAGNLHTSEHIKVVYIPRTNKVSQVALSYPNLAGTTHASSIRVGLEIPQKSVRMGDFIKGCFKLENPKNLEINRVDVSLENCEWIKIRSQKKLQRDRYDICSIIPSDIKAEIITGEFELKVPLDVPPTVEGTAISVLWLLKLSLNTDPPLEFKVPITVYSNYSE